MRVIKSCKQLTLRTDAPDFHVRVILRNLERLGWRVSRLGAPNVNPKPHEIEVGLVKDPTYYKSQEAALRALKNKASQP